MLSVDSKCRNTIILTGLTYTSSRKGFHDGCAKRGIFSCQKLTKNRLSLAHSALNRSFTVNEFVYILYECYCFLGQNMFLYYGQLVVIKCFDTAMYIFVKKKKKKRNYG